MTYFSRVTGVISLLVAALVLAACSASSRVVRTYEGAALDNSRVAVLFKPGDIKIEQVDGKPTKTYLLDNLEMNYELLPGPHTIVFRYNKVWAIAGAKRESGDRAAEEIQSDRLQVTFNAVAGRSYRFEVPQAESREDAIRIASGQGIQLVDDDDRSLAQAVPYMEPVAASSETTVAGQPESAAVTGTSLANLPEALGGSLSNLEALKVLWNGTNTEEKKEFLRWAFQ